MFLAAALAILAKMALALIRACMGPTAYDRMLATNMFGTNTVLLIAVGGYAIGWNSFVDVALLYAMVNFVSTVAIMRFFERHTADRGRSEPHEAGPRVADVEEAK
ncbi:MAG: monovalent cation/H+ antiporter complex subunit F [Planctomycetota bacterium]|jgi:multicomponent Na+:H+ antiporter subunit F|nr:monovalent cation/H+ antiporter complex subunit F [Planctomycetota bacterium]